MTKISMKPLCVIRAPVATRSGYGDMARDIARHMIAFGEYDVKIHSTTWGDCPMNALDPDNVMDKIILDRVIHEQLARQPDLFIVISVPSEFNKVGKFNIGITAGIETTLPPLSWIEGCNRMDTVWFISEFSKHTFENVAYNQTGPGGQVLRSVKVTVPMEVLPNCVNTKIFRKLDNESDLEPTIKETLKGVPEAFNFLFVGHWMQGNLGEDRKNVGLLIKIFLETFKMVTDKQPGLILKTSSSGFSIVDQGEILKKISMIRNTVDLEPGQTMPKVYLLHGELTESEMNSLYNHPKIKAHVSFTKGEGFGRPLLEASLTDKPIIASGWSGQLDFLDPETSTLIGGEMRKLDPSAVVPDVLLPDAQWFAVDIQQAANAMYGCFVDYPTFKKRMAPLRKKNRSKFNYDAVQTIMHGLLKKHLPPIVAPVELKLPTLRKVKVEPTATSE
jgi:glycosyltransferase involved in cell wall biosynthesis